MGKYLLFVQGTYFFVTGIWPILSIRTFQLVTGPKTDLWLVKTVGALAASIGVGLIVAAIRNAFVPEIITISLCSAFAFMCIDIYYVVKRVIIPGYLLDAIVELVFIFTWIAIIIF